MGGFFHCQAVEGSAKPWQMGVMSTATSYRPEIDGLRAIAVLFVVAYHYGATWLPGGFIGVDVFFVISGFLITGIIRKQMEAGTFSFLDFYARRARRILPALLVMLALTLFAGWFLLAPATYESLGMQATLAAVGASNFYFWRLIDYFTPTADTHALLHTWSLGVEEQFYLVIPAMLLAAFALRKWIKAAPFLTLCTVAIGSLALSTLLAERSPVAAFYLLPSRAWELALGGLISFAPPVRRKWACQLADATGLAAIIASALVYTSSTPFPGLTALLPCMGAALVVLPKSHQTATGCFLTTRAAVAIGLISYSLYLWHWPIVVFYRVLSWGDMPDTPSAIGLLLLAVLVSAFSWKYVEQPFRSGWSSTRALAWGAGSSMVAVVCGLVIAMSPLAASRFDADYQSMADQVRLESVLKYMQQNVCFVGKTEPFDRFDQTECLKLATDKPNVLIWGDSHAAHLVHGFRTSMPGVNFLHASSNSCPPVVDGRADYGDYCEKLNAFMFTQFDFSAVDHVIISHREGLAEDMLRQTANTAKFVIARGPSVTIVGPSPSFNIEVSKVVLAGAFPIGRMQQKLDQELNKRPFEIEKEVIASGVLDGIDYVSSLKALCSGTSCSAFTETGDPIFHDQDHYTTAGSITVAQRLIDQSPILTALQH